MTLPTHPAGHDGPSTPPRRNRRIALAAVGLLVLLASLHLLRAALG